MTAVTEAAGQRAQAVRAAHAKLAARNETAHAHVAAILAQPEMAARLARIYQEVMTRAAAVRSAQSLSVTESAQEQTHDHAPVTVQADR